MLTEVRARLEAACRRTGRDPSEVTLVAVTKGHEAPEIRRELLAKGQRVLAENRVQEYLRKAEALADEPGVEWHFIGNLQRNKVKFLAGGAVAPVTLIHSLNSVRLADALQKQAHKDATRFRVLVEVDVAGETTKQGVPLEEVEALVEHVRALPDLTLEGLMAMAPFHPDPEAARPTFRKLRGLRDKLGLAHLSMGMSGDFEVAVEEGATLVRIGSALFE